MNFTSILVILFSLVFPQSPSLASPTKKKETPGWTYLLTKDSGKVRFKAKGRPRALKINGEGVGAVGTLFVSGETLRGDFTFDLSSLDTGIRLRDRHMKNKYLELEKYPQAKIKLDPLHLEGFSQSNTLKREKVPFTGKMTLHGVTQPINGIAQIHKSNEFIQVHSEFRFRVSDYGIAIPSFAGVTMAEDVDVLIEFKASLNK